jgi:DNA polymerase III alpha subunit
LLSLPADDVFITTACVAFWKYDDVENIILKLKNHFKDNIMLEIQYHNTLQQITLNKKIKKFAYDNDIQMIVGLDSHYIYPEQADDRQNLLEANKVFYEDEEGWYMDYPDDDTIIQRFLEQGVFTRDEIQKAMDNTDICLTFDDIVLTDDIKLPTLYPNKTQEERNKIYTKLIASKLKEYIKDFPPDEKKKYITSVQQEVDVYKKTKMVDYPLIDYQIVKRAIEKGGLITDTGRGSGVGYFTNTLCGFSKVDRFKSPIKLYPERFISESRILETRSLPD